MSRWYRAYEGTVNDPKFGEASLIADCSRAVAIAAWHAILENAAAINDGGRYDTTARRIAVILCEPPALITSVLDAFSELGLITAGTVAAWGKVVGWDRPPAHEWAVIRKRIFARDHFRCSYCGQHGGRLECDHIVPVARGGAHSDDNLTTACRACNRSKGSKIGKAWRR